MGGSWSSERGVKRPREEDPVKTPGEASDGESELHTPRRKRFQSTSKYIVKTLFEEGIDSDVTIECLGNKWKLHKHYLCQCKYFDSMFSGSWAESNQSAITMDIIDENIDKEALKIAFKSLYTDNILVKPVQAVGVLAASTLLQLDPLIDHCKVVMKDCITCKTVCSFLTAAEQYGLLDIKDHCINWLLHCLMAPCNVPVLSDMSDQLLLRLLGDKDLWLLQVEMDVYSLLKKWLFLRFNPSWDGNMEQMHSESTAFFVDRFQVSGCCFLDSDEGRCYVPVFEKVRWMYVINDLSYIQQLKDDCIIPVEWLAPFYKFCWCLHLGTEQGVDKGPVGVSEEDFFKRAMRCGRVLMQEQEYQWRWLGYHYGLDLLFTLRNKVITLKRSSGTQPNFEGSLSRQKTRHLMLQVRVTQIRKKWLSTGMSTKSSSVLNVDLDDDDVEFVVLCLGQSFKFPLLVTMHLLYLNPNPSLPVPSMAVPPRPVTMVPSQSQTTATSASSTCHAAIGSIKERQEGGEATVSCLQEHQNKSVDEPVSSGSGEESLGASRNETDLASCSESSGASSSHIVSRLCINSMGSPRASPLSSSSSSLTSFLGEASAQGREERHCLPPNRLGRSAVRLVASSSLSATVSSSISSAVTLPSESSAAVVPPVASQPAAASVTVSSTPPSVVFPSTSSSSYDLAESSARPGASSLHSSAAIPKSISSSSSQSHTQERPHRARSRRVAMTRQQPTGTSQQ